MPFGFPQCEKVAALRFAHLFAKVIIFSVCERGLKKATLTEAARPFGACRVNVSKGRWGSCSGRKDINLSCYLALLPPHLRDYVMLHELCHTREMNHGPHFWALLDALTDGKAKALREELKGHRTEIEF